MQRDSFSSGRGTGTDSDATAPPCSEPRVPTAASNHHHQQQEHNTTGTDDGSPSQRPDEKHERRDSDRSSLWESTERDEDVELSSYFDIHFPNRHRATPTAAADKLSTTSSASCNNTTTITNHDSDDTIDL